MGDEDVPKFRAGRVAGRCGARARFFGEGCSGCVFRIRHVVTQHQHHSADVRTGSRGVFCLSMGKSCIRELSRLNSTFSIKAGKSPVLPLHGKAGRTAWSIHGVHGVHGVPAAPDTSLINDGGPGDGWVMGAPALAARAVAVAIAEVHGDMLA